MEPLIMRKNIKIRQAITVIEAKYIEILTVSEWAYEMGYSRAHFSRTFKEVFGLSPKYYLKEFRYKVLEREVSKDPHAIGYKIAVNCGFTDEQSLQKYLKYNFGITLNHFRTKFAKGNSENELRKERKRDQDQDGEEGAAVPI